MYHEKIMPNIKHIQSVYFLTRNSGFKFRSVTFTEGCQKIEKRYRNQHFFFVTHNYFTVLLSKPVSTNKISPGK